MHSFEILYDLDDQRIIPFLLTHERSSVYHHPAWLKGISKCFNHKAFYLLEIDDTNNITGLIPFMIINSNFTKKRVVSLPFSTHCDPLIDFNDLKAAIGFLKLHFDNNIKIDLRTLSNLNNILSDFSFSSEFTTHILEMDDSLESTFNSFHGRSVRASIRKAEKNDLSFEFLNNDNGLKIFYNLETDLRKRLALPPLPFKFFKKVFVELNKYNLICIPIVRKSNLPLAAGFILEFKDTTYLEYTASNRNYIDLYINQKLFWEIIKAAHIKGIRKIDFGRSNINHQTLIAFKEKWNAKPFFISNYWHPESNIIKKNKKTLNRVMKKVNMFMPASLLKIEGKLLYPHLD